MKKLYLHIGFQKTGTTAIQFFLWNNRQVLSENGYLYPDIGIGKCGHGVLANIIKPNNRDLRFDGYKSKFDQLIDSSNASTILLSSEVFLEGLNVADAVYRFFDPKKYEIKIIAYIRNQVDWLESLYYEVIRDPYRRLTGGICELREFQMKLYDYKKLLEPWGKRFGSKSITLRPYDEIRANKNLFCDFLKIIDINELSTFNYDIDKLHANLRFHPLASEFLRRLNRFAMMKDGHSVIVDELARISPMLTEKFGDQYSSITSNFGNLIMEECKEKNRALFNKFGGAKGNTLFGEKYTNNKNECSSCLTANVQHFIIDKMKPEVSLFIEGLSDSIKMRRPSELFLMAPPVDNERRLNEIIIRQRFELRKLYETQNN